MRRNDAPALRQTRPGVALAADTVGTVTGKFGIRGRVVGAEGRNDRAAQIAGKALRRATAAKRKDFCVAVKVLTCTVSNDILAVPEQCIQRLDVVADQCRLVAVKGSRNLGKDIRIIDLHALASSAAAIVINMQSDSRPSRSGSSVAPGTMSG